MPSSPESHTAASSRGGSASDTNISWHSANTAKTHHALTLFANLKANLRTAPAGLHATTDARRGSAPAAQSADNSVQHDNVPPPKPRRSSSVRSTGSVTPTRSAGPASPVPLTYTEAEIASLSPAQLRRQLRVAAAVTQRLHRRVQHLQKELEEGKVTATQRKGEEEGAERDTRQNGLQNERQDHVEAAAQALVAAEQRAERLQREVKQLTMDKETLANQLHEKQQQHDHVSGSSPSTTRGGRDMVPPQPSNTAARDRDIEVTFLRDTVRQLQHHLEVSEERVHRVRQLQLDALLQPRSTAKTQRPPTVEMVNAEVQKLFQLMEEQLASNAAQQQVERARMNELFYQLERQRGLM